MVSRSALPAQGSIEGGVFQNDLIRITAAFLESVAAGKNSAITQSDAEEIDAAIAYGVPQSINPSGRRNLQTEATTDHFSVNQGPAKGR